MSSLIKKGTSLLLQILFVVGLILVFSWFDPFDIFSPTKLKLNNTPVQVQSIKEIGQLVTAEYYGEVIASLKEVIDEEELDTLKQYNIVVDDIHQEFKSAMLEFSEESIENKKKETIFLKFSNFYPDLVEDPLFEPYIYYLYEKLKNKNYRRNDLKKKLTDTQKMLLIKKIYLNRYDYFDRLRVLETDEFKEIHKEEISLSSLKQYRNSRLVIIGRGWIKAGFDFGDFTENNFIYKEKRNTIHFIGIKPKILVSTINPWFIPEEGVEGFEFLIAERGARFSYEYTKKVKQRCLDKLEHQAATKNILEKAKDNAEIQLKELFTILTGEEIRGVYFHSNYLDYTLDELLSKGNQLSNEDILTIDSALLHYVKEYGTDNNRGVRISGFIDTISKMNTIIHGDTIDINRLSSILFSIFADRSLDTLDIAHINAISGKTLLDTIWLVKRASLETYFDDGSKIPTTAKIDLDTAFHSDYMDFCRNLSAIIVKKNITVDSNLRKFITDTCILNKIAILPSLKDTTDIKSKN